MKQLLTLLLLAGFATGIHAQFALPVTFDNPEEDTAWNQFANDPVDPTFMMQVENPDNSGINTSDSALMFIVRDDAAQWAGAWSDYYGPIAVTEENHMFEMMVYKDKISPSALKLEQGDGEPVQFELKVSNTVTGEWELLTFDFSEAIGVTYTRLVFFPDFPDEARTSGGTVYIDNIDWAGETSSKPSEFDRISIYPNPALDRMTVIYPDMNRITISNLVGQQLDDISFQNSDQREVDVSGLKTGVYFLTVESGGETSTTKFMKR
jgi:hypothetical protein